MGFPTYSAARLEQARHTAEIALVHAALHPHPSVLLEVLAAVADVHYLGHFDQRNLRHAQRQQSSRPCVSVCSSSPAGHAATHGLNRSWLPTVQIIDARDGLFHVALTVRLHIHGGSTTRASGGADHNGGDSQRLATRQAIVVFVHQRNADFLLAPQLLRKPHHKQRVRSRRTCVVVQPIAACDQPCT